MAERKHHPILEGLTALVVTSLGLALAIGLVVWVVIKAAGLDGGTESTGQAREGSSMYLPKPEKTDSSTGPLISAGPISVDPTASESADAEISLNSDQTAVAAMQQINLSGAFPGGDGAVLSVQRFSGGQWLDFGVTANVSGGQFSTYIQTGQSGPNRIRMSDPASGAVSNEVTVTVG